MRVSIWQQWASNHSVWFSVVGTFSDYETATAAATEIRLSLQQIQDYWKQIKLEDQREWDNETLSPPEEAIKQHYGIEWHPVDWYKYSSVREVDDPISVIDRFVVFSNPIGDTRIGPRPITYLLERLGASVAAFCEGSGTDPDSVLFAYITFVAPAKTHANEIEQMLRQHFEAGLRDVLEVEDVRPNHSTGESPYRWYEVTVSRRGEGVVQRDGLRIAIQRVSLVDFVQIGIFVKDISSWLKHQHCTDIKISFSSECDSQGG